MCAIAGRPVRLAFTPHLVPANRGILSTCYASLTGDTTLTELLSLYRQEYAGEPFVRVLPEGCLPNINQVRGSNFCDIGLAVDPRTQRVIVVAAIDNLVKGAAGQALQNMNLMLGLQESAGLRGAALFP
jgi:N-acetyl-gamma-glutamyl-phosphate reductase